MKILSFFTNIFIRNLIAAIIILITLSIGVLKWLDTYTHHGESVEIPEVKGMQVEIAAPLFSGRELSYEINDSTFDKRVKPGSIIETNPPVGTKVKKGRKVYLTINSFMAQRITIPEVKDLSQRQASAILRSIGFEKVEIRRVPGAYQDLVVGIESRGRTVEAGERLTLETSLTLLVSSGTEEIINPEDSIVSDREPEESWF
ncbi:PASTA domain-containing protein [Bacteroidia bacterium]|nr:PASTA domain-containing protein [Bacteroidia bacterium]